MPGRETRVDFSLADGDVLAAGDLIEITTGGDGWSVDYREVANVHGFSRGLFAFMIVAAAATRANPVGILPSVALFVLVPGLRAVPIRVLPNSPGYDGQFYAQLVVGPLLLDARPPARRSTPRPTGASRS